MTRLDARWVATLWVGFMVPYLLMTYGGVRSPDCEIVFRTAESMEQTGTLQVNSRLTTWPDFGVAEGTDGNLYSVFGPALGVLASPLVWIGDEMADTPWFRHSQHWIPLSFFVDSGMSEYLEGSRPKDMIPHLHRFLGALVNILMTAAGVVFFALIVRRMGGSRQAATVMAAFHGLGTLAWPYSGTFFSEPAATTFALLSLYFLVSSDPTYRPNVRLRGVAMVASGVSLGLSVLAHITSVLFIPFFLAYAIGVAWRANGTSSHPEPETAVPDKDRKPLPRTGWLTAGLAWSVGCAVILGILAYLNWSRFGNPLETGRTADMAIYSRLEYGHFQAPWSGLAGLLFSSGKGLLWYSPIVIVGLAFWPRFHRSNRLLSTTIALTALTRIVFIASRSDWHGGFCLGPRYLVPIIPFLILPMVPFVTRTIDQGFRKGIAALIVLLFASMSQQVFFSLGEPISYYYGVRVGLWDDHVLNLFKHNLIYRDWRLSPLLHSLDWRRGPFLLQGVPLSNYVLWVIIVGFSALFSWAAYRQLTMDS